MGNKLVLPKLTSFLKTLGLEHYQETFKTHAIDDAEPPHLTDSDLQEFFKV